MTGTREKRNHAFYKLFFAALLAGPAVLAPISADAQLRPWDAGNEVLVDMSVLENGGFGPAPRTSGGIVLPSLRGNLLDPPRRAPRSRLLYNSPPSADQAKGTDLPKVKLIPPSEWSKKKPATRRAPSKPRPKLKSAPKMPAAQKPATRLTPKPPVAPAPPAQPKPEVKISKAPPPPPAVSPPKAPDVKAPPPPPAVAKAAPVPEKPAAPATQTASREPAPASQNVAFASGTSSLSSASQKQLDGVAAQLNAQPDARMQLLAYAGEPNMSSSKARRLSLSRALAVRSYLINKGVKSTRIDVRALGNQVPEGSPSRVDLRVIGN